MTLPVAPFFSADLPIIQAPHTPVQAYQNSVGSVRDGIGLDVKKAAIGKATCTRKINKRPA